MSNKKTWEVNPDNDWEVVCNGVVIADCATHIYDDETMNNAKLISAAPDLLKACNVASEYLSLFKTK